jgi:hypothetical protein
MYNDVPLVQPWRKKKTGGKGRVIFGERGGGTFLFTYEEMTQQKLPSVLGIPHVSKAMLMMGISWAECRQDLAQPQPAKNMEQHKNLKRRRTQSDTV